jgi:hypothetical protein
VAAAWKYVLASAIAGSTSALIIRTLPSLAAASGAVEAALHIVVSTLLFGILYLSAVILLHQGCTPLYQFASVLREMVPWERFRKSTLPSYPGVEPEPLAVSQPKAV